MSCQNLFYAPFILMLLAACQPAPSTTTTPTFPSGKWVDLSYSYGEKTLYWPTSELFKLDTVSEGMTDKGYYYSAYQFCTAEHGGTHMDAPIHFAQGRQSVEQIPVDQLMGDLVVIDVSEAAANDQDYLIQTKDFEMWEEVHGAIPDKSIVLLNTGYGKYWPDALKYMGTTERGAEAVAKLHFPGLHPDAAKWISENRTIKAIGLDTPSIDYGQSTHFETHQILADKNIPIMENVANVDQLPSTGAFLIGLPMKVEGGSGAPIRIVALIPE